MSGFKKNLGSGGKRAGGGFKKKRSFGGSGGGFNKGPRGGFGGGQERSQLHDAVCAECGEETQVPFRPNGRKPVLCRDCFQSAGGGSSERSGGRDSSRPNHEKRGSFDAKPEANGNIERHLVEINEKLERIVLALETLARNDS